MKNQFALMVGLGLFLASSDTFASESETKAQTPVKSQASDVTPTTESSVVSVKPEPKPAKKAPTKVLMLDLKASLVEPEVAKIVTGMISAELGQYEEYDLITGEDLRQMVALEAEKQQAGCSDDSSCLAEIAGAMGARYVVFGDVGKLDDIIVVNLNLFDSQEAKGAGRVMLQSKGLGQIPTKVPQAVHQLLFGSKKKMASDGAVSSSVIKTQMPFPWTRVGTAGGLAVAGLGVALGWGLPSLLAAITAEETYLAAGTDDLQRSAKFDAAKAAQDTYWAGPAWGLMVGGVVAAATGGYAGYVAVTYNE